MQKTIILGTFTRMSRKASVYRITNKKDGTVYIGKSVNPTKRWKDHVRSAEYPLTRAMVLDGVENFEFSIVEEHEAEETALDSEMKLVRETLSLGEPVYNRTQARGCKSMPKKGYTWNGTVYRERAKNHWFGTWRWDSEHSWIRVGVPDSIQDKREAISWFRKYVRNRLEELNSRVSVLNPLLFGPKKVS